MGDVQLTVRDVAAGGDGIAALPDGRVAFVRGGLPGDTVEVAVTAEQARLVRAEVVTVVHPSPHRVVPPCPHVAGGCGGCGWQHVRPADEPALKERIVDESLRRIARVEGLPVRSVALPPGGGRTTVRLLVVGGRPAFRRASSHDPVLVDHCLAAHPLVDEVIAGSDFGDASEVTIRAGVATGERLVLTDGDPGTVRTLPGVAVARTGDDVAIHEIVAGVRFRIGAASFFQTRPDGAEALVTAVTDALGPAPIDHLIDLYGGVGLFAATVGAGATRRTVVEGSRSSTADAAVNVPGAAIVRRSVERWRPEPADAVVADPPRAGLGKPGADAIAATGAGRVALVSCDPASLARDAGLLRDRGYAAMGITVVALFPGTPHLEAVTAFTRTT